MNVNIEETVGQIIADRESEGRLPQCDLHDIIRKIEPEIIGEMREMIKSGRYTGSITINKIPILKKK